MSLPPRQLPLELAPAPPSYAAEDFLVSACNAAAHAFLRKWPDWPHRIVVLIGPPGAGKSHLAAIWAASSHARVLAAHEINQSNVPDCATSNALVIENMDQLPRDEAALFHLVNLARERGIFCVITATREPAEWGIETADLLSRIRLAPLLHIAVPDDDLIRALLVKLFVDRQLAVDNAVVAYAALHVERSFEACRHLVERLDKEALARQSRVTRALVSQVLGRETPETDSVESKE